MRFSGSVGLGLVGTSGPLVVGDPAGWAKSQLSELNAFDILRACGFEASRAPTNLIGPRIECVERLLSRQVEGKAALLFNTPGTSPGMRHLIEAMDGKYRYKRKTDGSYEALPAKDEWSHCADSLQYACLGVDMEASRQRRKWEVTQVSMAGWV
jgi:hypothetical protein